MKLNNLSIRRIMAEKAYNAVDLAKAYGCSGQRMRVILNSVRLSEKTVGKLARALSVDAAEIIEQ